MAAEHTCAGCRRTTTNNAYHCEDCLYAMNKAEADLRATGRRVNFADIDAARQQALLDRFHLVNG